MLARVTGARQLTLPDDLLASFPGVGCFDVSEDGGRIVLTQVCAGGVDAVRRKLAERHHGGGCAGCGDVGEATRLI